jgi:hypothetical protein
MRLRIELFNLIELIAVQTDYEMIQLHVLTVCIRGPPSDCGSILTYSSTGFSCDGSDAT